MRSKRPDGYMNPITKDLVRMGIPEQKAPTYNRSETKMLENTVRVRRLVEQMEKKETEEDEA